MWQTKPLADANTAWELNPKELEHGLGDAAERAGQKPDKAGLKCHRDRLGPMRRDPDPSPGRLLTPAIAQAADISKGLDDPRKHN